MRLVHWEGVYGGLGGLERQEDSTAWQAVDLEVAARAGCRRHLAGLLRLLLLLELHRTNVFLGSVVARSAAVDYLPYIPDCSARGAAHSRGALPLRRRVHLQHAGEVLTVLCGN